MVGVSVEGGDGWSVFCSVCFSILSVLPDWVGWFTFRLTGSLCPFPGVKIPMSLALHPRRGPGPRVNRTSFVPGDLSRSPVDPGPFQ